MQPEQFFTPISIMSVGAATLAVNVVTNTFYKLAKLSPKWTAFITSIAVAYFVVALQASPLWYDWVLAFLNGCLLFCSALGINELGAHATPQGKGVVKAKPLVNSWFT